MPGGKVTSGVTSSAVNPVAGNGLRYPVINAVANRGASGYNGTNLMELMKGSNDLMFLERSMSDSGAWVNPDEKLQRLKDTVAARKLNISLAQYRHGLKIIENIQKEFAKIFSKRIRDSLSDGNTNRVGERSSQRLSEGAGSKAIDDAAEALMDGAQYTKVGRIKALKPNISYKSTGGHLYKTGSLGRIDSVEGALKLGNGKRNDYAQKVAGREDRLADDHGGHLIASIFEGSGDHDNLVPMNGNLNQGAWKAMENTWADALKEGKEVKVLIDTVYSGNSQRPSKFIVEYVINGEKKFKIFNNIAGG
ncbi:MAG: hypothetical protein BGN88_07675 [Clostridiales bacterium 43-6]|nr:MAG: hypothetical protein BGN88_07675 [Clostridiales bacterium 43-6]